MGSEDTAHSEGVSEGGDLHELQTWLDGHANFEQNMPARAQVPTLDRIAQLCRLLGDPQLACPVVHVTGTNGKGSTVRILSTLFAARGLSVGTYTSPNLLTVNERMARNGRPVPDDDLAAGLAALRRLEPLVDGRVTRFELLTAAAFAWFAEVAVDVAVVEVGLGGRWDATNVVRPDVCVVTNVSADHLEVLGPTLVDVAKEKAGIVKPGAHLVLGETAPDLADVFLAAAAEAGAPVWLRDRDFGCAANRLAVGGRLLDLRTPFGRFEDVFLALHGAHQGDNAAGALAAAEAFFDGPMPRDIVDEAFSAVEIPGRLEVVGRSPLVLLDGAHNVAGAEALGRALADELPVAGERIAVVGMLRGRDPTEMLQPLAAAGIRSVVACTAPSDRGLPAGDVAAAARALGLRVDVVDDAGGAVRSALAAATNQDLIVVTGSLYVVAEARRILVAPERGDGTGDEGAGADTGHGQHRNGIRPSFTGSEPWGANGSAGPQVDGPGWSG